MNCCGGNQDQEEDVAPFNNQLGTENRPCRQVAPFNNQSVAQLSPYSQGPFSTTDGRTELPIQYSKEGIASKNETPARTLIEVFKSVISKRGDKGALRIEDPMPPLKGMEFPPALPLDKWKTWTFQEYYNDVCRAAKSLIKLGVQQHDAVNVFGFNSPEWFIGQMSAIFVGGKVAGIYPTDTVEQVSFKCRHSGATAAFVEDAKKLEKFCKAAADLNNLRAIVC